MALVVLVTLVVLANRQSLVLAVEDWLGVHLKELRA